MPIELNDSNAAVGTPVLRQQRIGEMAALAVIRTEQRNRLKKNFTTGAMEPIPNGTDLNGTPKFKQEIVIHGMVMPGTTMEAGLGDVRGIPQPGDRVRLILKAKGFGQWIEARRAHRGGKLNVGDVLTLITEHAQQYDQGGVAKGPKITDQATADATPRGVTIGFYGPLALQPGTDPAWIEAAENAYRADELAKQQRNAIPLDDAPDWDAPSSYAPPVAPAPPYGQPPVAPPPAIPARPSAPAYHH